MSERSSRADEPNRQPTQLRLLSGAEPAHDWVLDERTRQLGRSGVAQAREILRRAQPPEPHFPEPVVRKAS